ncbi:MAG: beta-propeller fold lactonase family protein [Alphaproteobacteria bacterium]
MTMIGVVAATAARAELAVSANDGKLKLVGGKTIVPADPVPDTLTVIDLAGAPRVVGDVRVGASVIGPPSSVAVVRDESFAVVSAAAKIDTKDRSKTVPDNKVTLINLRARPPKIVDVGEAGIGAAGVAISPSGHLVLVANRGEGTVSVFVIKGKRLKEAGKIALGDPRCGPSGIVFTPDGKRALVTRDGDSAISVLQIDSEKVSYSGRDLHAGLKPYAIDVAAGGAYAAVANIGVGGGDADTVSLIDLKAEPPRVVDTLTVGQTPEGLKISPDGRFIAVTVMNGSNKEEGSPFFNDYGLLMILAIEGPRLVKINTAPIGHWCQGAAWSRDGRRVLAGCMVEEEVVVFGFDGAALTFRGRLAMKAGPAALATAR